MEEKKYRLLLTIEELTAVKNALYLFVVNSYESPYDLTDAMMASVPTAADVLLTHFGG